MSALAHTFVYLFILFVFWPILVGVALHRAGMLG